MNISFEIAFLNYNILYMGSNTVEAEGTLLFYLSHHW